MRFLIMVKLMQYYIVKDEDGNLFYDDLLLLENLNGINRKIRIDILSLLSEKPMYPMELAKKLNLHEQKVYYHIKEMQKSGVISVFEKTEIRGTTAKKYKPTAMNFGVALKNNWREFGLLKKSQDEKVTNFLQPFVENGKLNCSIIVGSPDPHGPHKARARDGHYAVDLGLFLGNYCSLKRGFSVKLDVDAEFNENMILVGGPVTNLINTKVNEHLPVRFSDQKPWGIMGKFKHYSDDACGLIAKIPNPFDKNYTIMVLAGIRFIGTKVAVMALTRYTKLVLNRFSEQKEFSCVVQGFDMDGDGKIDSIEVLE